MRNGATKAPVLTATSTIDAYYGRLHRPVTSLAVTYKSGSKLRALAISEDNNRAIIAGASTLKILNLHDEPLTCTVSRDVRQDTLNQDWSIRNYEIPTRSPGRYAEVYDLDTAKRDLFDIEDVVWSTGAFSTHIATAVRNGKIVLYDLARPGMHVNSYHDHMRQVHMLDFNPYDGRYLLSGAQDGLVKLWDLRVDRPATTFPGRSEAIRAVRWSPTDACAFAFGTDSGSVQYWSIRNDKQAIRIRHAHYPTCSAVDWHPDGKHLASAGHDSTIKVWDMTTEPAVRKPVHEFQTPQPVQNLRWRPACFERSKQELVRQCTQLVTSYREHPHLHVWDLRRPHVPLREMLHSTNSGTTDIAWRSRDLLLAVGNQGDFHQFDIPFTMRPITKYPPAVACWTSHDDLIISMNPPPKNAKPVSAERQRKRNKQIKDWLDAENEKENPDYTTYPGSEHRRRRARRGRSQYRELSPQHLRRRTKSHNDLGEKYAFRTIGDDGCDDMFLPTRSARRLRIGSADTPYRWAYGESDIKERPPMDLKKSLSRYKPYKCKQQTWMLSPGLPLMRKRQEVQFLSENYRKAPLERPDEDEFGAYFQETCAHNAKVARQTNIYKDSKHWQVLEQVTKFDTVDNGKRLIAAADDVEFEKDKEKEPGPIAPINELFLDLLKYYCDGSWTRTHPAAELLKLLLPLAPNADKLPLESEEDIDAEAIEKYRSDLKFAGIPYANAAGIMLKHEKNLRARAMHLEAAHARKLAYPHFPAAFAWCRQDKQIGIDRSKPQDCPFCWEKSSPYGGGANLRTWCSNCGHCVHMMCAEILWKDTSTEASGGGKCPAEGCLCACVSGWWEDQLNARAAEAVAKKNVKGKGRVLEDERAVGESKAVERVRGALREERTGGGGRGKKVTFEG